MSHQDERINHGRGRRSEKLRIQHESKSKEISRRVMKGSPRTSTTGYPVQTGTSRKYQKKEEVKEEKIMKWIIT